MMTGIVILIVFAAVAYCSKNLDGMGSESRKLSLLQEITSSYLFNSDGYNSRGYDLYGYNKDGINEFGFDKFGNKVH